MSTFSLDNVLSQFAFKKDTKKGLKTSTNSQNTTQTSVRSGPSPKKVSVNKKPSNGHQKTSTDDPHAFKKVKKTILNKTDNKREISEHQTIEGELSDNVKTKENFKVSKVISERFSDPNFEVTELGEELDSGPGPDTSKVNAKTNSEEKWKPISKYKRNPKPGSENFGAQYDPEDLKVTLETLKQPSWAKEPNIRDSKGKAPHEEGYDPTTLYVPPHYLNKMSIVMKKYWEVKSQHYDKLVFIRLQGAYYVYGRDAYICHIERGSKLHYQSSFNLVYLYPQNIDKTCQFLIEKNYKIVMVEPTQMYMNRDEAKLEVYQVLTKGTYIEANSDNFTSRYCLMLTRSDDNWGFTYFDTTTHEFYMGGFTDTLNTPKLRSLLLRVMPVEIVCRAKNISKETILMLKNLYWNPILTILPMSPPRGAESILYRIRTCLKQRSKNKEDAQTEAEKDETVDKDISALTSLLDLAEDFVEDARKDGRPLNQDQCPYYWTLHGVYFALEYLEYLYLAETIFQKCRFFLDGCSSSSQQNMILDGQSVHSLELLSTPYISSNTTYGMSLLKYMDKTKSPFGKRMFRKWLLEPLKNAEKINMRLDAVEELMGCDLYDLIQSRLSKLGDIERMIHNVYNFGNRNIFQYNDFDVYAKPKLNMFVALLKELREADNTIRFLAEFLSKVKSKRLIQLLSYNKGQDDQNNEAINGLFPQIDGFLLELEASFVMHDNLPIPAPGRDSAFDMLMEQANDVKSKLKRELDNAKRLLKCQSIIYVHTHQRYELEIPDYLVEGNKKPKEYVITSKKKGYIRCHTPEIQDLVVQLKELEHEMHIVILPFLVSRFKDFFAHHKEWQQVIHCLSELDCLSSLAQLARTMPYSTRPNFISPTSNKSLQSPPQVFDLRGVIHPCLSSVATQVVPNDITLSPQQRVFLISGPNMGGKSTLMRSVCIATIMAQMGSYVPAVSFDLTPCDRIFTRIGASDNIFEGKSTFFVELEETMHIMTAATTNSLVVIDELGRGTSTYDGMAIAYAVLKHLTESVKCVTFFATHFHMLLDEFRLYKSVETYYMESGFENDELIRFLYKFKKGWTGNSFGLSVARMAGLSNDVIEVAKRKTQKMNKEQAIIHENSVVSSRFNNVLLGLMNDKNSSDPDKTFENLSSVVNHI